MDINTVGDIVKRTEAKRIALEKKVLEDMQKDKEAGDK